MGLVRRVPDPKDRRGVIIRLTPRGRALADRAIELHFAELAQLLSALTSTERSSLARLLCKLLSSIEQSEYGTRHAPRTAARPRPRVNRAHVTGAAASLPRTPAE
jgi:hypothetical protein